VTKIFKINRLGPFFILLVSFEDVLTFDRCTCHAGHVDHASSGPPQQWQEQLTHVDGRQEVDVHAASEGGERLQLCNHRAM